MPESATNSASNSTNPLASAWAVISWAAFLACSWTWCIGMWLPVILLRDFGVWSFAAFAIPNVVGAAAMGIVLRKRGMSEWLTTEHELAAKAFSVVTIAFQLFFLFWLGGFGTGRPFTWTHAAILLVAFVAVLAFNSATQWIRQQAVAIWLVSLLMLLWSFGGKAPSISAIPPPVLDSSELLWLSPVFVFGLLLCPYLDLTFHRARRALPGAAGSAAFVIGFGVLFLAMIVGSLGYGIALIANHAEPLPWQLPTIVAAHIVMQLFYTIAVHQGSLGGSMNNGRNLIDRIKPQQAVSLRTAIVAIGSLFLLVSFALGGKLNHAGLTGTEIIYRTFLAFYGLVFPAYVWICMIPFGSTRTQRRVLVFALAVALAAPFYWLGFIERLTIWLVPGVAIVLLAKAFAGSAPRRVVNEVRSRSSHAAQG